SYFASRDQKPAPKAAPAEKKAAPAPRKAAAPAAEKPAEKAAPAPAAEKPAEKAAPAPAAEKPAEKAAPAPAAEKPAEKAAPAPAAPADRKPGTDRRPQGDRPQGDRFGDRRPQGDRPQGDRFGDRRPQQGDRRPQGDRSQSGGQQQYGRPSGDRRPQNGQQSAPYQYGRPSADRSRPPVQRPAAPAAQKPAAPAASAEPVEKERTVRRVDTKGSDVNLDKWNTRYDEIAPQSRMKESQQQRKQKLKQKSQQQKGKGRFSGKKETEAEKLQRLALERARKQQLKVMIPDEITVSELASRLKATVTDVIKKLMMLGVMAAQHETIDFDTASLVAEEMGAKVEKEVIVTIEEQLISDVEDDSDSLMERSPVVVVMGHVDHGKTSILDRIRNAHVTATEAGGITQHIGAYQVQVSGKTITFLDTPGHEAFTAMRARGAAVTDIAILVVAADDGIMPQTVEAINHAKAAGVSIIVAINKMDKPTANPDKVMQELTEYELVPEAWGGDVICVPVSAVTGQGIDELLENILLVAEVQELKANPNRLAKGTVVEARLDKGRGPVATVLVQNGTLRTGDVIIAGTAVGRVRQMINDRGAVVTEAGPSVPVEITGMTEVPAAGDIFNAVENERLARELVEQRRHEQKEEQFNSVRKVTLDNLFSQIAEGEMKELDIIVKADVQGSAEAVKQSLEKLSGDEVRVRVIHTGVGAISRSDIMLANASNAIIIGFNVRPDPVAKADAEEHHVEMRMYRIIYDAIDDVKAAMKGMLDPKTREVELGRLEVRMVYKISNVGNVAGCYVTDGKITRDAQIRVVRDGIVIAEDRIDSLKRFKNDAKEVAQGYECGVTLERFSDIKEGDIFEAFMIEEYREE
ncbi:MAG: translation initiation factor IF-2, partial [Oscillospiraceae bacterium]|nr:translation initiation factor IF-2 [Oscillospiraceae bacterium]